MKDLIHEIERLDSLRIELIAAEQHPDIHRDIEQILAAMQTVNSKIAVLLNPNEGGFIASEITSDVDYSKFVGKKMKGFEFESIEDGIQFRADMEKHISEIGVIIHYYKESNGFLVNFGLHITWNYPANLAIKHIVE